MPVQNKKNIRYRQLSFSNQAKRPLFSQKKKKEGKKREEGKKKQGREFRHIFFNPSCVEKTLCGLSLPPGSNR